ncbi:hypothetical protein SSX86_009342 [Deinandra increscens subsp. villosa]|uniref:Uncharacterized protein n=1 Tax=Deinandra increscens subsp. villosa TaxID=3103831 RepID=A0AAP0DED0_9ASTR
MEEQSFFDKMMLNLRSTCKYYTGYPKDLGPSRVIHFTSEREFIHLLHQGHPVIVAFTIKSNYTKHLDKVLEEAAAELYPQIKFMRVECPKYIGFCMTRQKKDYPFIEMFHSPEQSNNQGRSVDPNVTKYAVKVLPYNYDVSAYGFREFFKRHNILSSNHNEGPHLMVDVEMNKNLCFDLLLDVIGHFDGGLKGCRSSSRRPRRSNSNTIDIACGEPITNDTADFEMPVSVSEKLGVFVLGCHFSEKAEHIPIKKRKFLFRASSPPRNTTNQPSEGAERHETSPKLNSSANSLPPTYEAVAEICDRGSKDHKLDKKELVKDDDFSGISILAAAACSNSLGAEADLCEGSGLVPSVTKTPEVPKTVEFNENNVKKEPDSHTSTTPSKGDESTLINSSSHVPLELPVSKTKQEPSIQKSPSRDVRFSWDLNTVMDACEEPFVSEHEISTDKATYVKEKKNNYMEVKFESPSKSIINKKLVVELNSFAHENKAVKVEKCESLSHFDSAKHAVVVKTESLHDKPTDSASDAIPVTSTLSLESPAHGIFSKCVNLCGHSSGGFGSKQAVDTKLSIDCSIPPGFDHCLNLHAFKENAGPRTQTFMNEHDLSLKTATHVEDGPHQSAVTSNKHEDEAMAKMELTSDMVTMEDLVNNEETDKGGSKVVMEDQPVTISSMHDADNGLGCNNSQSDNIAGSGIAKVDENSVGYDSQYEDGELREWTTHAWNGYELTDGENEYDMNRENGLDMGILDARETNSHNGQERSSGIELTEVRSGKEAELTSSVVLPGKRHNGDDIVSGSEPNETTLGQEKSEIQDNVEQHATQLDEWKMNVSGWDLLPESRRINSHNFEKTRNFTARRFSYREEQKDRFGTEDMKRKTEGPRFYRKESLTRIEGSSAHNGFLGRSRFQMHGFSSKEGDGLTSRPERESGALRSYGRGRYSPHDRPSGREGGMDPDDVGRHNVPSYVSRQPFRRSRSPMNREVNDFRARLGLRPTGDTGHDRFMNPSRGRGRGRSMRYVTQLDGEGGKGRYHGPATDDCDKFTTDYSHPFPTKRRCFSPIDRRGNSSYQHHRSDSRSPSRPQTRSPIGNSGFRRRSRSPGYRPDARSSRSPSFRPDARSSRSPGYRPDARIQRPRSPGYRDHPGEYSLGPRNRNSLPVSSRWVNYKERPVFNRSPPPGRTDGPQGERFSFYDSSRKPKHNDYYRSGHPGNDFNEGGRGRPRYVHNDGDRPDNGYRRGGFVRRYNMDGPAKRFQYEDEDRCGRDETDSRFRDFPRRQREESGEVKRRSRDGKDQKEESEHIVGDFERRPGEVKDQSTGSNLDPMAANEVAKEGD